MKTIKINKKEVNNIKSDVNKVYCEDCRHSFKQKQGVYGLYIGTEYQTNTYYCWNSKTANKIVVPATPIFKERIKEFFNECIKINKNNDCPYFEDKNEIKIGLVIPPIKEKWYKKLLIFLSC